MSECHWSKNGGINTLYMYSSFFLLINMFYLKLCIHCRKSRRGRETKMRLPLNYRPTSVDQIEEEEGEGEEVKALEWEGL